jgi:hypothetical protein
MTKIKKFNNFTDSALSDDIVALQKTINGDFEKIEEPIKIIKILDIITDEKEIEKLEEGIQLDTSLTIKNIQRGQVIWLTALIEKPNSTTAWNAQTLSTIKCRIIDYYFGLNKLKTINR